MSGHEARMVDGRAGGRVGGRMGGWVEYMWAAARMPALGAAHVHARRQLVAGWLAVQQADAWRPLHTLTPPSSLAAATGAATAAAAADAACRRSVCLAVLLLTAGWFAAAVWRARQEGRVW